MAFALDAHFGEDVGEFAGNSGRDRVFGRKSGFQLLRPFQRRGLVAGEPFDILVEFLEQCARLGVQFTAVLEFAVQFRE